VLRLSESAWTDLIATDGRISLRHGRSASSRTVKSQKAGTG
jgi:hypothetical protein